VTNSGIGSDGWFAGPEWQRAVDQNAKGEFILTKLHMMEGGKLQGVWNEVLVKPNVNILARPRLRKIKAHEITEEQWRKLLQGVGASAGEIRVVLIMLGFRPTMTGHAFDCGLRLGGAVCSCGVESNS
jgi:hypothetical protein